MLTPEQHDKLAGTLSDWGVDPEVIEEMLADAVFGPGVIGMEGDQSLGLGAGVGILVAEDGDPAIDGCFTRRAELTDQAFVTEWETTGPLGVVAVLCPHSPEAILALTTEIMRPRAARRTYLVLCSKAVKALTSLLSPGTTIWLVPEQLAWAHWATEGVATRGELYSKALPLAHVEEPMPVIRRALAHVAAGNSGPRS